MVHSHDKQIFDAFLFLFFLKRWKRKKKEHDVWDRGRERERRDWEEKKTFGICEKV